MSGIDRENGLVVVQAYGTENVSVINIQTHVLLEGEPNPDIPLHLELYRRFPSAEGIAHIRTQWISFFADAGEGIPLAGVPFAHYFSEPIPCRAFSSLEAMDCRTHGVLAPALGAFTWANTPMGAAEYAVILNCMAKTAHTTRILSCFSDAVHDN